MSVTWAIARHMMAECIRMRVALALLALLGMLVFGLPFAIEAKGPLTDAVQAFVTYGLRGTGAVLGILTIFLAGSLSQEFVQKQILVLMAKPVPRWQFILGKWLGITLLNVIFLVFATGVIYGMVQYIRATHPPIDETYDEFRLENEVMVARAHRRPQHPDWARQAEAEFQSRLEVGDYEDVPNFDPQREKERLYKKHRAAWRVVGPLDGREFKFTRVLPRRGPDETIQLRYKTEVYNFPIDEIFRAIWWFGEPSKGTPVYQLPVRHVVGRYHIMSVPADAVASDGTLTVRFQNRNPYVGHPNWPMERQFGNVIEFRAEDEVEVLFVVDSFEGNLVRVVVLMLCKLAFLAAVALLATTIFSFPVACLASFTIYVLSATRSFVLESFDWTSPDQATWSTSFKDFLMHLVTWLYTALAMIVPDFAYFDGVEELVDGRNVGLYWTLEGVVFLFILRTGFVLGLAMLFFHRREVSEVSL